MKFISDFEFSLLYLCPLLNAAKHLFEAIPLKPNHHLVTCCNDWNAPGTRDSYHFVQCSPVLGHIIFRKFVAFLRKKLFRHFAIGSGRCRINFDFFCHVIPPRSVFDLFPTLYSYTYPISIVNECFCFCVCIFPLYHSSASTLTPTLSLKGEGINGRQQIPFLLPSRIKGQGIK